MFMETLSNILRGQNSPNETLRINRVWYYNNTIVHSSVLMYSHRNKKEHRI